MANSQRPSPMINTARPAERALLVGIEIDSRGWGVHDSLEELEQLASTAGIDVVGTTYQRLQAPHPSYLVGKGKLEELAELRAELNYDLVIFDEELSPRQQRNIENRLDVKILDRAALILDIFAQRAQTHEGRLQVELAQLEYRLPRLTRLWTHLSRQTVGGVGLRGPGETQLEVDRRRARERISQLHSQLEQVRTHRQLYRKRRREEGIPVVSLVGYTNAGKSTLLNALASADVLVEDKLFATLDPTTRKIMLSDGQEVLLTDTVGFIQRLPTTLVAAFRATLEEVTEADVLLHVLDITHPNAAEQFQTVTQILAELGCQDKPVLYALNKIDALVSNLDEPGLHALAEDMGDQLGIRQDYVLVSALKRLGFDALLERLRMALSSGLIRMQVTIPYDQSELVNLFHRKGIIDREDFQENGTVIEGRIPVRYMDQLSRYAS